MNRISSLATAVAFGLGSAGLAAVTRPGRSVPLRQRRPGLRRWRRLFDRLARQAVPQLWLRLRCTALGCDLLADSRNDQNMCEATSASLSPQRAAAGPPAGDNSEATERSATPRSLLRHAPQLSHRLPVSSAFLSLERLEGAGGPGAAAMAAGGGRGGWGCGGRCTYWGPGGAGRQSRHSSAAGGGGRLEPAGRNGLQERPVSPGTGTAAQGGGLDAPAATKARQPAGGCPQQFGGVLQRGWPPQ